MSVESLIIWLLIGAIAGWLAGLIVKGHGFGLVGNIIVGIVGAFLAGLLLPMLGLSIGGSPIVG
ncbi:MAG: GlsB/YeaQ/YmgE family stress response membrane protein, partial [Dokdonella sp.]